MRIPPFGRASFLFISLVGLVGLNIAGAIANVAGAWDALDKWGVAAPLIHFVGAVWWFLSNHTILVILMFATIEFFYYLAHLKPEQARKREYTRARQRAKTGSGRQKKRRQR